MTWDFNLTDADREEIDRRVYIEYRESVAISHIKSMWDAKYRKNEIRKRLENNYIIERNLELLGL